MQHPAALLARWRERPGTLAAPGFDVHLVKPVETSDLVRILDERNGASLH